MAKTIEELNFKLKVDDAAFKAQMKADEKSAKDLSRTIREYLNIKRAQGTLTAKEYQTLKRLDNLESNRRINAEKELAAQAKRLAAEERLAKVKDGNNRRQVTHNRLLREAASLSASYVSILGAKKLIENIVQTTGEFELQRTTLAAMLQDAERATQIFEQLKFFSVKSPFSFKELATYAKQLTAYSVPVTELFNTTKMLADVSAGLGVGMDRLVLAYGQVRSAEFLRGQEVRQFTESGIPILEELRKQFVAMGEEGITVADVFDKISKRLVPFEMVDKVFKDLTSEGGKFYQMQEVQSETLKGKISNLKDAYMIMFNEIGSRQSGLLKGGVDVLRGLAENYEKIGRLLVGLISAYGTYRAAMLITEIATKSFILSNHKLINSFVSLGRFLKTNPYVALATAVAAVAGYFITAGVQASRFCKELEGIVSVKFAEAEKSAETFKRLAGQIKESTEGSQNYRDAISQLNRQYGDYLPNLLTEKNALDEILKVENEVTNAIYARAKAYASEEGMRKIEERFAPALNDSGESLIDLLTATLRVNGALVGEDAARDFIKGFRVALENESTNPQELFLDKIREYFGSGDVDRNYAIGYVRAYADAVRGLIDENKDFLKQIDTRFGAQGYSSDIERRITEPIVAAYNKALQELRGQKLPAEEFADKATALELARLHHLKQAFEELNTDGSWTNKLKEIQTQIDALKPKDLGWLQKLVNPLVTGRGNNDLKARVDTKYEEYLDNLHKEYKAVAEAYADSDKTYRKLTTDKQKGVEVDADILRKATEQNELYKQRKNLIIAIATALGIEDTLENKKTGGGTGKSQAQKDLETRIDLLKKLQDAYEKLSEYVGDDKIGGVLSDLFSSTQIPGKEDIIGGLKYEQQLIAAADELEKYDKAAAERLRSSIGKDAVSEAVRTYRDLANARKRVLSEAERYYALMRDWGGKDFNIEGSGVIFDIRKIVASLSNEIDAIEQKSEGARKLLTAAQKGDEVAIAEIRKKYGDEFWEHYIQKGSQAIDELSEKEKGASRKVAQEKINDLAQKYVKETLFDANIDLNELSDKNIMQLLKLHERLQQAMDDNPVVITADVGRILDANGVGKLENGEYDLSNVDIDSLRDGESAISDATRNLLTLVKTVQGAKLNFNSLGESISKIFKGKIGDLVDEERKKLLSIASSAMDAAGEIGGLIVKIGEINGDSGMKGAGEAIEGLASVGSSIAQGFASGGVWGAAIAGGIELIKQFANGFLEAAIYAKAAQKSMEDFAYAVKMADLEKLIEGGTGIFGNNPIGNLHKDQKAMKQAYDAILKQEEEFLANEELLYGDSRKTEWWQWIGAVLLPGVYQTLSGWTKIGTGQWDWMDILNVADAGALSQILDPTGIEKFAFEMLSASDAVNVFAASFKNMQIMTKDYNGFLEFFGARDEYMSLGDFFPDLFNADGTINYDLLDEAIEAIESNGIKLTEAQKKMLDTMRDNYEKYKDALEDIKDYLTEIFGEVANTIADNMIDAFARSGDAAVEMGDVFLDVTKKMAKDMIVNILYTKVFDQLQEKVTGIYSSIEDPAQRTEATLLAFREGLNDVAALSPEITALLQGLEEMLGVSFAEGADNLADGIKGITEDTANLLASYLNAIRADVSIGKEQRANILAEIRNMASYVASPTLLDYVNKIQANTYDMANTNREILERINSVLTLGNDGTAVRVYS